MNGDLKLTTAIAAALLAAACHREADEWNADRDTAVCVDRQGKRVPDASCPRQGYHSAGVSPFLWYYLGRGSRIPYYGDAVGGGSYTRAPGRGYYSAPTGTAVTRAGAVSRGGFGSTGHGGEGAGE